jgi:hypothetical protein
MDIATKHIEWNGAKQQEAIDILLGKGHMIVSPTKVGYIIMTSDVGGLKRKFSAKQRTIGDLAGKNRFDARIKRGILCGRHEKIITSYCQNDSDVVHLRQVIPHRPTTAVR